MPGIQSFCVCSAFSLASIYVLQITWYSACMVLDEKRISNSRCYTVSNKINCLQPKMSTSSNGILKTPAAGFKELLNSSIFKGIIILSSFLLLVVGIFGCININVKFKYQQLLPEDSYLRQLIKATDILYPNDGFHGYVYTGSLNSSNLGNVEDLIMRLQRLKGSGNVLKGKKLASQYLK